jgi:hypothetical protein
MYPMHPAMVEASARIRVAELRDLPSTRPRGHRARSGRQLWRRELGWLLINLGLRLAIPRPSLRPATR